MGENSLTHKLMEVFMPESDEGTMRIMASMLAHKIAKEGIDTSALRDLPGIATRLGVSKSEVEKVVRRVLPEVFSIISGAAVVELIWKDDGRTVHTSKFTKSE